ERVLVLTNKPTTIKEEIPIDLPRPRDYLDKDFVKLRTTTLSRLWSSIGVLLSRPKGSLLVSPNGHPRPDGLTCLRSLSTDACKRTSLIRLLIYRDINNFYDRCFLNSNLSLP
ncbi:MAG: hypothetical protein E7K64_10530, partial [Clostridia bacterium]|nr:hypothetical protein [Clostridia bacterium]